MADVIVTANQSLYGKYAANVFCFNNLVNDATRLQTFADNFRAEWATHLAGGQHINWSLDSLTFSFIDGASIDFSLTVGFTSGPLNGSNAVDESVAQTALLVSNAYIGSRPNRGRTYLMGFTENSLTDGLFSQSLRDAAELFMEALIAGISDGVGDAFLRILRRPSSVFPVYTSNPVDTCTAQVSPASQRRRRQIA